MCLHLSKKQWPSPSQAHFSICGKKFPPGPQLTSTAGVPAAFRSVLRGEFSGASADPTEPVSDLHSAEAEGLPS